MGKGRSCLDLECYVVPLVGRDAFYCLAIRVVELNVVVGGVDGVSEGASVVQCWLDGVIIVHQLVGDTQPKGTRQALHCGEGRPELRVEGEGQCHQ